MQCAEFAVTLETGLSECIREPMHIKDDMEMEGSGEKHSREKRSATEGTLNKYGYKYVS